MACGASNVGHRPKRPKKDDEIVANTASTRAAGALWNLLGLIDRMHAGCKCCILGGEPYVVHRILYAKQMLSRLQSTGVVVQVPLLVNLVWLDRS